jgi:hypothetical protein
MNRSLRMTIRFAAIVLVVGALAISLAPPSRTGSPYLSALSDLAASPAFAAKGGGCHSICEFVSPGHVCLHEGSGSKCVVGSTGGCTTVPCGG